MTRLKVPMVLLLAAVTAACTVRIPGMAVVAASKAGEASARWSQLRPRAGDDRTGEPVRLPSPERSSSQQPSGAAEPRTVPRAVEQHSSSSRLTRTEGPSSTAVKSLPSQEDLKGAAKALTRKLDAALNESNAPPPPELLAELDATVAKLEVSNKPDAAAYLRHVTLTYRLEGAARLPLAASGEALAQQLGGRVVASGEVRGKDKPVTFAFKAQAGKCYSTFPQLKASGSRDDEIKWFFYDAPKDNAALQRFRVNWGRRAPGLPTLVAEGACALTAVEVTATAQLAYVGSSNGMRYTVLEHDRERLPTALQLFIEPVASDSCDVKNWLSLWTNPIPGSVLYAEGVPVMPTALAFDSHWSTARSVDGRELRVTRDGLSVAAPRAMQFAKGIQTQGCPRDPRWAHSADGLRISTCWAGLDSNFKSRFKDVNYQQANASDIFTKADANRAAAKVGTAYDRAADRSCQPMEDAVSVKFESAFKKAVDFYLATPVSASWNRAEALRSLERGERELAQ